MSPPRKSARRNRILIVDDHPVFRDGLRMIIDQEDDMEISHECNDAAQALEAVGSTKPDLVLADISLPGRSGLELIKDLQSLSPDLPVLAISMHDEALYAERVLRAGGRGYIMKQAGGKRIMAAIRQVLSGRISVSEDMSALILENLSGRSSRRSGSPIESLTDREFEVFQLLGQGLTTRQIANRLNLSIKTVEVHRLHIKDKLELKTANELVRHAVRWVEAESS